MLTTADFEAMYLYRGDEWLGFGYLGERLNVLRSEDPRRAELVAEADAKALAVANALGLTADQLFAWANSKTGRWYGDCMFGSNGQHADKYTPARTF